jgi:hypothetical protein
MRPLGLHDVHVYEAGRPITGNNLHGDLTAHGEQGIPTNCIVLQATALGNRSNCIL